MPDENIREPHERLLDAAARLFGERGVERVNTNQIAREAGVGVGTFYKHFCDKYAVRSALVVRGVAALQRLVAERVGAVAPGEAEAEVRGQAVALVELAAREPALFRAAFGGEVGGRPAGGRPTVGYSTRAIERRLGALQAEGRLDAGLAPDLAARATGAMQIGLVCWWLEDPRRATADAVVETLVRLHPAVSCRTA